MHKKEKRVEVIELEGDIVKIGVCMCFRNNSKLPSIQQISRGTKLFQIILAWLTILIQIWLTYELLSISDDDQSEIDDPPPSLYYWAGFILIIMQTSSDIHYHVRVLWLSIAESNFRLKDLECLSHQMLLIFQVYQSILASFVAYNIVLQQDGLLDIMVNYAGILVIVQIDNYVGEWFLTQLEHYEDLMQFDREEKIDKDHGYINLAIRTQTQILTFSVFFMMSINFFNKDDRNWLIKNETSVSVIVLITIILGSVLSFIYIVYEQKIINELELEQNYEFYFNNILDSINRLYNNISQNKYQLENDLNYLQDLQVKYQLENQEDTQITQQTIIKNINLESKYLNLLETCKEKIEILSNPKEKALLNIIDDPINLKFEQFKLKNFIHLQDEIIIKQIQQPQEILKKIQEFQQDKFFKELLEQENQDKLKLNLNFIKQLGRKQNEIELIKNSERYEYDENTDRCKVCDNKLDYLTSYYYQPFQRLYYCSKCIENDDREILQLEDDFLFYISDPSQKLNSTKNQESELCKDVFINQHYACLKCGPKSKAQKLIFYDEDFICNECFKKQKTEYFPYAIVKIEFQEESSQSIYLNLIVQIKRN